MRYYEVRMNAIDVVVILVVSSVVAVGVRVGLFRQVGLAMGMLTGCFVAALAQTLLAPFVTNSVGSANSTHIVYWLLVVAAVLFVCLISDVGWAAGGWLQRQPHLRRLLRRPAEIWLGKAAAAVLGSLVAFMSLWLLSTMFTANPNPTITRLVGHSVILSSFTKKLPAAPALFAQASHLLNPHAEPTVFFGSEPPFDAAGSPKGVSPQFTKAVEPSVVKIVGTGCGGVTIGTGFVAAENLVLTNAHVVAGLPNTKIAVYDSNGSHQAVLVRFNPALDIAVLRVTGLIGKPIPIDVGPDWHGGDGATFGYASGSLRTHAATIVSRQSATGYDIYDDGLVTRDVYIVQGDIEKGDSGSPLLNKDGHVIGLVFAKSSRDKNIGYALSAVEMSQDLVGALSVTGGVSAGRCGAD